MNSGVLIVVPIEIADPGVLTSTNVDGSADPAAYNPATTYGAGDRATVGNTIYQSAVAANTGNAPATSPTFWVVVGAINKLRMFDHKIGSQTEFADLIEVEITPGAVVRVLSLRNLDATSVTVTQTTVAEGVVFTQTLELDEPVADWLEYWFDEINRQTDAVVSGLLPFTDAVLTVTINNPGGIAKCGELLLGPAMEPGGAEFGLSDGIDDYSVIEPDAWGVRDIVERDFADNMDLTIVVRKERSPAFRRLLTQRRAKPILVVSTDARPDAQVYGLAESWRRTLSYPNWDIFNLTMKGLT
jgi:hypothetical protein